MSTQPEEPDEDNPEFTAEDFKKARPFSDLPEEVQQAFRKNKKSS